MPKINIIAGLDIGTSSLKILVAKKSEEPDLEVLALVKANSAGVRKGVVVDVDEVSNIIQDLVNQVNRETSGQKISSVYVNIGGSHIFCTPSHGLVSVSRADQKISEEDISRVLQAAQIFSLPSNKEILDVFTREFIVDGEKEIKEPLGMQGVRLEVEVSVLAGFSPYLKNLNQAVLGSGLQIADRLPSVIAASRACLSRRQKEIGVAILDIGAGTSDLAVFEEGDLIHLAVLPIGAGHITNDIAIGLKIDVDLAEGIKLEFGKYFSSSSAKKEKIEIEGEEPVFFSQRLLSKIMTARVSEIFREVNKELKKISRQGLLPAGIVLTGGGAKLPKIIEMAKKELHLSCRKGMPQGISLPEKDPSLATVCGLVLEGADLEAEPSGSGGLGIFAKGLGGQIKKIFKIFIP